MKNILRVFLITFGVNVVADAVLLALFGVKIFTKQSLIILLIISGLLTLIFKQLNLINKD